MVNHEIVGSVMSGDKDPVSEVIGLDIYSDRLADDPRVYFYIKSGNEDITICFPLKEIFKAIEKEILS